MFFRPNISNKDKADIVRGVSNSVRGTLDGMEIIPSKVLKSATFYVVGVLHFDSYMDYITIQDPDVPGSFKSIARHNKREDISYYIPYTTDKHYLSKDEEDHLIEDLKQSFEYSKFKKEQLQKKSGANYTEEFFISYCIDSKYVDGFRVRL